MKVKVFISYVREDYNIAKKLYDDLKIAGITPWMAKEDLLPGEKWKSSIDRAIKDSNYFIALFSSNSLSKTGYFHKEVKTAFEYFDTMPSTEIYLLPVRLDNTEPSEELKDLQWTDIFPSYEIGLKKILKVINRLKNNNNPEIEMNESQYTDTQRTDNEISEIQYLPCRPCRRLPLYILISCSESMMGEPIEAVKSGISMLINSLRGEPQALETAYVSIILFTDIAWQAVPLTDLISFQEPELRAGSNHSALGAAFSLLNESINREVVSPNYNHKGDFCPLVFVLTDRNPTDDWKSAAISLFERRRYDIKLIICCAGFGVNPDIFKFITEHVIQLKSTSATDIGKFFEWRSQSFSI